MEFRTSSHRTRWLFTADQLETMRAANWQRGLDAIAKARTTLSLPPADPAVDADPPTRADEAALIAFFAAQAQTLCSALRLPTKASAAALYYLHRFFARASVLETDPKDVMLASIYVAAKAEECYVSADRLAAAAGVAAAAVLRREPGLLQGVGFDLLVWLPHRALEGHWTLLADARGAADAAATLGAPLAAAPQADLDAARAASHRALAVLLRSDAPLLRPPGQLAVAALRSGLKKVGLPFGGFGAYLTRRAVADAGDAAGPDVTPASLEGDLMAGLSQLDALAAAAAAPPSPDAARAADARVRRARAPLAEAGKAAAAERDAGAADARAGRAAAKRAAAAAREAELLGPAPPLLDVGGGGGEEGPSAGGKRRKSEAGPVAGGG